MSVFDGLKFRKVHSPIHNLDPRIKFIYVIALFVVAILFGQILPLLACNKHSYPIFLFGVRVDWR
jgi:energy-coupling factor transporter transmembrane protein EcfT